MEYFVMLLVCCSATIVSTEPSATNQKPNIVFILADDFGFNDIGYHAKDHLSQMKTPNLDKLAEEGIKLENYYVQQSCTPSRSQLMSGRYQIHTGLQHHIIMTDQANGLPLNNIILPEQLRRCGYDTHMVGKWHLGFYKTEYLPWKRGFNSFYGFLTGSENYYTRVKGRGIDFGSSEDGPINSTWGEYSAHLFAKRVDDIIRKRDEPKPMFMYVAFQSVHAPMMVPEEYIKPFANIKDRTRRTYAGMVAAMDEAVGNITKSLADAGMLDNTIIIFSTDNGGCVNRGGNNWPLKGRKNSLWEGGIRGVGFIHGKALRLHGVKSNQLIHVSDWLPTILSATDCPVVDGTPPLDGFDQWSAIQEKTKSPRNEILHNIDPLFSDIDNHPQDEGFDIRVNAAIRVGAWKLLTGPHRFDEWFSPPESSKRHRDSAKSKKRISPKEKKKVQLYNIESDPYEEWEISDSHPLIVERLLSKLEKYNRTAVPVRYPPHDRNALPTMHRPFWGPWLD